MRNIFANIARTLIQTINLNTVRKRKSLFPRILVPNSNAKLVSVKKIIKDIIARFARKRTAIILQSNARLVLLFTMARVYKLPKAF